jgi:hypothetical protein
MKIELLLNRVSLETSIKTDKVAFNGWFHGPASNDKDIPGVFPMIDLRKESWGGLFVYGPTAQIFTVDSKAFSLLERIKNGESLIDLTKNPLPFDSRDITLFKTQLKKNEINFSKG